MPDLDILIQIADYYDVDIREILDGERKGEKMNKELEESVLKVADYSNIEKERMTKRTHGLYLLGVAALIIYVILESAGLADAGVGACAADFALGLSLGVLVCGVIFTSRYKHKIKAFKMRLLKKNNTR